MPKHARAQLSTLTVAARQLQSDAAFEARVTRSKAVPNNSWDAVQQLSNFCGRLLLAGTGMLPALRDQNVRAQVEDNDSLNQLVQILARDSKQFADNLVGMRARHEGKTGNAQGDDENMLAIQLYTEYGQFAEQFEAIVQPTIMHMVEILRKAEEKLREIDNDAADIVGAKTSIILDSALDREHVEVPAESAAEEAPAEVKQARGVTTSIYHVDDSPFQSPLEETDPAASTDTVVNENPAE